MKYKNYNLTNNLKPLNEKMVLSNYDEYAKLVSDAYINAPDFDDSVVPSYRALMESTKKLYKRLQSKVKVEFVDYDPYSSRNEMADDVKNTGILKISKLFNEHPLYSKEENLILRAVHDYYTHIIANQDFGLRGELKAYNTHARLAPPAALPALFTEVVGQVCYAIVNGDFTKQKICKLDGFDYLNVGKIDDVDIVNKQLKITEKKPYSESIGKYTTMRTFKDNVSNGELTWHRDREDRIILPINENDWYLQMDNELPVKLHINEEFFIPKNTYHRVIKGSSDLIVEVIKTNFEEEECEIIEEGKNKKKKKDACYYKVKSRYDVWPSAYACVPEDTSKALTRNGWKSVYELNVGDEIMTYNIEKDELEFKPVLNLHRYKDVKTNVVRSGNNGFIFEATDNHKWVVKLPEIKGKRLEKYNRVNGKALIETADLLVNKYNKHLVVSAQYNGGQNIKLDKIFKYGTNWVKYILDITNEQRQAWLFSSIVYDGNQKKVERLTENIKKIDELDWLYTSTNEKQSFGFKQKDIEHRDAFLLSAFLNSGLVTWKKIKDKDIYSCHYTSNKRFKNTSNFKLVKENISDVWCPETENGTWVMMQETDGNGIITITGNSGALVKCRKVGAKNWGNKTDENVDVSEVKKTDYSKEKEKGLRGWFERQGGEGSKGWVDCNTCKKDPETGRKKCKPCGRKEGENRKYPACRPTPSACGTKGKGKSWGKKSNESILNSEKNSIFEENIKDMILYKLHEMDISGFDTPVEDPIIKPKTPVKSPSPRRKRIWEVKPAVSPKPKM
jgi:hypothetical protein